MQTETDIPAEIVTAYANARRGSDRYPYEIVRWISGSTVEVREMTATLDPAWKPEMHAGGFSAICSNNWSQRYTYEQNPSAPVVRLRKSRRYGWRDAGGTQFELSESPRRFHDYNF